MASPMKPMRARCSDTRSTGGAWSGLAGVRTSRPVPERLIRNTAAAVDRVVVVEMNMGQYVREIQRLLPGKPVSFLGQMNGNLIKPEQIREVI